MRGTYLAAGELDALHGVGPLAFSAYVWLRSWADLRDGAVGRSRAVSLAMLAAYCEQHVPKGSGMQIVKPSERNIRTALSALQRAGLLVRIPDDRRLVFRLPIMDRPNCVRNEPDAFPTGEPDTARGMVRDGRKAGNDAGFRLVRNLNPTPNLTGVNRPNSTHIGEQRTTLRQTTTTHSTLVHATRDDDVVLSAEEKKLADVLRGEGVRIRDGDQTALEGLVRQGIGLSDLLAAVARCRAAREKAGSQQPLNVGFVASLLNSHPRGDWRTDDASALALGRESGIEPRPGENWPEFRNRLAAALRECA